MEEILIWRMVFVPTNWKYHSSPIENKTIETASPIYLSIPNSLSSQEKRTENERKEKERKERITTPST
jgi:hypothetical protein